MRAIRVSASVAALGFVAVVTVACGGSEPAPAPAETIKPTTVGEMSRLLEWTSPLMHRQSVLLAMKGPKAYDEIDAVPMRIRKHFEISTIELSMPELPGHVIVKVRRAASA